MSVQNPNQPISIWQFAPGSDANAGYPAGAGWYDFTPRVIGWDTTAGKQRELGLAQTGTANVLCRDVDEWLNPGNTSSPWNSGGNSLKLYRPIRHAEMWPLTGNILNSTNNVWLKVIGDVAAFNANYADLSSFEGGTTGGWHTVNGASTMTLANSAVRAHDGTKSMLLTWQTEASPGFGSLSSIVSGGLPLRAGYTYTLSAWVWIVSGPAVTLRCNGNQATSATTTGAWQRISVTWAATADGTFSTHYFLFAASATTAGQQVFVDSVQLELGGSASTYTTSGPTIYPIFTGFIERYPSTWKHAGFEGWCTLQCIDSLGMMPRVELLSALNMEIQADSPSIWWTFDDGQVAGSSNFTQRGSSRDSSLTGWNGVSGTAGTATSTVTTTSFGGPGPDQPAAIFFSPAWNAAVYPAAPDVGAGFFDPITSGVIGGGTSLTYEFWFNAVSGAGWQERIFTATGTNLANNNDASQFYLTSAGKLTYKHWSTAPATVTTISYTGASLFNDQWTHVVLTENSVASTITATLYVNGTLVGTGTRSGATIEIRRILYLGNPQDGSTGGAVLGANDYFQGQISNLIIYNSVLSSGRVTAHYDMGRDAYYNETVGKRATRILAYAGYTGIGVDINVASGVLLGSPRGWNGTTVADQLKVATDSDQGLIYAAASGLLTYLPQTAIAASSSTLTFGENTAGSEVPYAEEANTELEPSNVFNYITVSQYQPTGQTDPFLADVIATDATSITEYGKRTMGLSILTLTGASGFTQMTTMATFLLNQKKEPRQMVNAVTVRPSANTSLFPQVLPLSIGQNVTWKRRTSAGVTITIQGYVQTISWSSTPTDGLSCTVVIEPIQV